MSEFKCPKCGATLKLDLKEVVQKGMTLEQTKGLFSVDLLDSLTFSQQDSDIIITPKRYLGTEKFAKIARIIRRAGGEYISAGKNSHFIIASKKE